MAARVVAGASGKLRAAPDDVWALLTDWAGVMRWWPANNSETLVDDGYVLTEVKLDGGEAEIPRTRVISSKAGTSVTETLLHQDDDLRRIYYDLCDDGIPGIRNYRATTTLDAESDGWSRLTFHSTFDVLPDTDADLKRSQIESVYKDAILYGFSVCLKAELAID